MTIHITDNGPSLYPGVRYTAVSSEWDLGDPVGHGDTPELAEADLSEQLEDRLASEAGVTVTSIVDRRPIAEQEASWQRLRDMIQGWRAKS